MNPQQLSAMDPKLREAYERVMGLAVAPKAANPTPSTQAPSTPPIQNTMPPVIEKPLTQDFQPARHPNRGYRSRQTACRCRAKREWPPFAPWF